jgi:glycosyltransferase involved in cell wall biosynthesis
VARISILFATRNGARTLPRMLDTLERLAPPSGGWRAVAVDNGSCDESLGILQERAARLPMTVVSEPRRGKNIALNTGLALVEGDIIALTDDDIILPADWLITIESVAAQKAEYDIFGGPIQPAWEEPPPDWVLRCLPKGLLGWTDFPEGPIDAPLIWGGNMAVRAVVFRKQRFSEDFEMHSETEFTSRSYASGHRCWHFHASPVGHIIRPYQYEPEWHLQRMYNVGRADRRRVHADNRKRPARRFVSSLRQRLPLVKGGCHFAWAACRIVSSRLVGDFDSQFKASLWLKYWQGCFAEEYAHLISLAVPSANDKPAAGATVGDR